MNERKKVCSANCLLPALIIVRLNAEIFVAITTLYSIVFMFFFSSRKRLFDRKNSLYFRSNNFVYYNCNDGNKLIIVLLLVLE